MLVTDARAVSCCWYCCDGKLYWFYVISTSRCAWRLIEKMKQQTATKQARDRETEFNLRHFYERTYFNNLYEQIYILLKRFQTDTSSFIPSMNDGVFFLNLLFSLFFLPTEIQYTICKRNARTVQWNAKIIRFFYWFLHK